MDLTPKLVNCWKHISDNWGDLRHLFLSALPIDEYVMFDDQGFLVPSERPLIESLICEMQAKSRKFFYYAAAAGVFTVPEADVKITEGPTGRIIEIGGYTGAQMGIGSRGDVHR